MEIRPIKKFSKRLKCKSDKSVTHRAVMFNAAFGESATVTDPLISADCLSTVECMRALGAEIEVGNTVRIVRGGITKTDALLDCGNSGTTMRLMTGLMSGITGTFRLIGDDSLSRRPMKRVTEPLSAMGARVVSTDGHAPLEVTGGKLHAIDYTMPVKSAQVKSAILLAALGAEGTTIVRESTKSRDHTERMLARMGADLRVDGSTVYLTGGRKLHGIDVNVCGDISSAAYAMSLAAGTDGGTAVIDNVGINPTRTGILDVLKEMGAGVSLDNIRRGVEDTATVTVTGRVHRAVTVGGDIIPRLIDELPVIAVLMALCEGESVIKDAAELKVKETDRIATTVSALKNLGVEVEATPDGMRIFGRGAIAGGGTVDSCGDHRIAMAMSVAMALSHRGGTLLGEECCAVSYPDFFSVHFSE